MKMKQSLYERALAEARKASPDLGKVFSMLQKADQGGDPRAAYALGTWWLHGHYVKKDVRKGLQLIRAAASANVSDALFDLAVSFELGNGMPKNDEKAALSYLQAALNGDEQAFFEVGRCYYYGIGFRKDRGLARVWLEKAKRLGTFDAAKGRPRKSVSLR